MTSEKKEKFRKVFEDPDFLDEILECENGKQVEEKLKEKNIHLDSESIDDFAKELLKAMKMHNRISVPELAEVSGGKDDFNKSDLPVAVAQLYETYDARVKDEFKAQKMR